MGAISDSDVSIDASGNIRWTGAATTNRHTILEFIQWLMDKQDDGQAAGNDLLDITVDTPFDRSTDQIVTLNSPFNIDDTFATHLYDGSVTQNGGDDIYSGLAVIGPVETGTEYMILQGGKVLPSFWGTGINAEASPSLVFSRHLVKSREGGADIDGQRITVLARELGDQYRRFPVTLGTGNSVAAISNGADIFNEKSDATLAGYTTITNTEGFQQIDIDGNGTGAGVNEYYSQWTKAALEVNDVYERAKWISQRSHQTDVTENFVADTDSIIENGTIDGQAQSFIARATVELLTEARANIKINAGTPTGTCYAELYISDDAASELAEPTGGLLARSEDVLASAFTSSYEETIFRFNRFNPATGADQIDGLRLTASQEYFIVFRHDAGDSSNNLAISSDVTNPDSTMNTAESSAATWTAAAGEDIYLEVKSSPEIHGVPGEIFQGINVEVGYTGESGAGVLETEATNDELAIWGTRITYNGLTGSFREGEYVGIYADGTTTSPKSGGQVLYDDGTDMVVALENPSASVIASTDDIIGVTSGADANVTAVVDEDLSGGSGYVLAKDDNGTTGELYLQVISGVNPVNTNVIRSTSGAALTAYVDASASITTRTLNPEFIGTSTGSNIIGTYGIGFNKDDVGASDKFFDLSNTDRTPPNNVVFTVSGLVAGEDRVLVGPRSGSALDRGQWLVSTLLSSETETSLVVKTGTDTVPFPDAEENWPDTGIGSDNSRLRIERDDGIYARVPYDSHDGNNTFTLGTPNTGTATIEVNATNGTFNRLADGDFLAEGFEHGSVFTGSGFTNGGNNAQFLVASANASLITVYDSTGMVTESGGGGNEVLASDGWDFSATNDSANAAVNNDVFMAFIDVLADATSETFTGVHTTANDRNLFVRVRDGGGTPIKTFESTSAQFKSTPQTVAAVRTADV